MNPKTPYGTSEDAQHVRLDLSVVVPLYNEEENLEELVRNILNALEKIQKSSEIILVNDGSTDRTLEIAREAARSNSRIKVINLKRNTGQTGALAAGFEYSRGEVIVPMDGDLQNDPEDIGLLLDELNRGYDVVSGWRKDRKDGALLRRLPSQVANKLISWVSGVHLHDYGCTLKAYRGEVIRSVRLYGEMHRFIPIFVKWEGGRITEMPVRHHPRQRGKSKYGLGRTFTVILDIVLIRFLERYLTKPVHVFGGFGLICFGISFAVFFWILYLKFVHGTSMILTPLPTLCAMTFLTGMTSCLMGVLAEIIVRTYFEAQDKRIYAVKDTMNTESEE